jgi:hypothetical protein
MRVKMRRRFTRVTEGPLMAALCGVLLATVGGTASAQIARDWTDIDARGTAVDWSSLEEQQPQRGEPMIALIWARTVDHGDTIAVQAAVRCAPAHIAVVTVQRPRSGGYVDVSGPVSLSALAWQDPPPLSYLKQVMRAVCVHLHARNRPC